MVFAQAMVCIEIIKLEDRVCGGRRDKSRLDTFLPAMTISAAAKFGLTKTLELTTNRRTTLFSMTSNYLVSVALSWSVVVGACFGLLLPRLFRRWRRIV